MRKTRDAGLFPELGRSPGGRHGRGREKRNPLQFSCLENPMDRGAWWATVHGVAKSWSWLKQLSMHTRVDELGSITINVINEKNLTSRYGDSSYLLCVLFMFPVYSLLSRVWSSVFSMLFLPFPIFPLILSPSFPYFFPPCSPCLLHSIQFFLFFFCFFQLSYGRAQLSAYFNWEETET